MQNVQANGGHDMYHTNVQNAAKVSTNKELLDYTSQDIGG